MFSLTTSQQPVVEVVTRLNGIVQSRLQGADLRATAGTYMILPIARGTYQLSVSATTAAGCEDGANRPMPIVVN